MPKFTSDDAGTKKVDNVTLYIGGGDKRLYLADAKVNKSSDISLTSIDPSVGTAKIKSLFNGPKGIWTVDLTPKKKGNVEIKAKVKDSVAKLKISIVDGLALPPASGNEGLLARLFLAESRSPDEANYNVGDSKKGMTWMELVLHNRLGNNPDQFNAPNAKSIADIVKAKGQFKGFENYPNIAATITSRINKIFALANSNNDRRQPQYRSFVENALAVAKPKLIKDPSPDGIYGWRTAGSSAPGGRFVAYGAALSGNQFYTLIQGRAIVITAPNGLSVRPKPKLEGKPIAKLPRQRTVYVVENSATTADGYSWVQLSNGQSVSRQDIGQKWIAQFKVKPKETYINPTIK